MRMMKRILVPLLGIACGLVGASAPAVTTSHWVHGNEADFEAGTLHNVVVTNLGDVKLSRAVTVIQQEDPNVTTVNCLAAGADGVIYAGTGPKGVLLSVKNDKVSTVTTIDGAINILCLLPDATGGLLIGTGGEAGKILRIDKPGDKPHEIFSAEGVQYIWALTQTSDGEVYAATGPNGQVFQIHPDGSHVELYKSDENNITSMISDGKDLLYLGTDPDGLVIRLNRKTKEPFILYNAAESEITALSLDDSGNLYAATGEAGDREDQPAPAAPDNKETAGRPEGDTSVTPIPSNPTPKPPQPPELPNPNPGEPKPIPKQPQAHLLPTGGLSWPLLMDDPGGDEPGPGDGGNGGTNPSGGPDMGNTTETHPAAAGAAPSTPAEARPQGNAIYKIDKDGFVTEIFREDAVIYSMLAQGGVLLVGTGSDGEIYQVNPAAEETVALAKVDAKQVMCLLPASDGRIFIGLANTGGISAMSGGYATDGTYISPVLDATQASRFGNVQLHGQLPDGTSLKIATRSGNVKDSDASGWSPWSADVNASEYVKVAAPSARFLQYRLTFGTTDSSKTPLVDHVDVMYQIPNLAPVIKSVKIGSDTDTDTSTPPAEHVDLSKPGGTGTQTITWDASDPNNDVLTYSLYFRTEQNGPWILLKDKLKDTTFDWDTRTVADGRYQVKVVASDAASNPPGEGKTASRVSDSYVVDNTPPTLGDLKYTVTNQDLQINLRVLDQVSIIAEVDYTVDSSDDWQAVLPVDNIFDSPDETVAFTIKGLTPGTHQVTIRAVDARGNQALQTLVVKIDSEK
jgi:hypothetical protein